MTSHELKQKLQETLQLPMSGINTLMESVAETIGDFVKDSDEVAIPGFGTFSPVKYDERVTTDLDTAQMILMPPSIEVMFKPSVVIRKRFIG